MDLNLLEKGLSDKRHRAGTAIACPGTHEQHHALVATITCGGFVAWLARCRGVSASPSGRQLAAQLTLQHSACSQVYH